MINMYQRLKSCKNERVAIFFLDKYSCHCLAVSNSGIFPEIILINMGKKETLHQHCLVYSKVSLFSKGTADLVSSVIAFNPYLVYYFNTKISINIYGRFLNEICRIHVGGFQKYFIPAFVFYLKIFLFRYSGGILFQPSIIQKNL